MKIITILSILLASTLLYAQQPLNIVITNAVADSVLKGNYNPNDYQPGAELASTDKIICTIQSAVSPDSLKHYLEVMRTFHNRNTYSDTLSATRGIGAGRKWALQKFQQFSSRVHGRLLPAYVQFDMPANTSCGAGRFKDIIGVLPGTQVANPGIIIIEAHLDSRCAGECDTLCLAEGMEDNGSGSALVLELARVMSRFAFDHTIVFMLTVGEEQGLFGAEAMADYCQQNSIPVLAVQNNDVVGGIYCGESASAPSCPFENHIDSTHVRLFSSGTTNSKHKSYARYVKMMYEEKLRSIVDVPMEVTIMAPEDRTGRGGDHIPFPENGFTAIRFTSANEHGDGSVQDTAYHDRQHTSDDILGVDTDGDSELDSFFVSFTYLARNTVINGISAAMCALAPATPTDLTINSNGSNISVTITDTMHYNHYRVGVRSSSNDFDAVYTVRDTNYSTIPHLASGTQYRISVAAVSQDGVMSLFSQEKNVTPTVNSVGVADTIDFAEVDCSVLSDGLIRKSPSFKTAMWAQPNPASETVHIYIEVQEPITNRLNYIKLYDMKGVVVRQKPASLQRELNVVELDVKTLPAGTYQCLLFGEQMLLQKVQLVIAR